MARPKRKPKPRQQCRLCDEFNGRPVVIVIAGDKHQADRWINENRPYFLKAHYASGAAAFAGFNSCTSRVVRVGTYGASETGRRADSFARLLAMPEFGTPCRRCK